MKWTRITTKEQFEDLKVGDKVIKYQINVIGNGGENETIEVDDKNTTFEVSLIDRIDVKRYFLKPINYTPSEEDITLQINNFLSVNTTVQQGYWYKETN